VGLLPSVDHLHPSRTFRTVGLDTRNRLSRGPTFTGIDLPLRVIAVLITLIEDSRPFIGSVYRWAITQVTIVKRSLGRVACLTGKLTVSSGRSDQRQNTAFSLIYTVSHRTSDPRSFPPKNSTSYGDIRGSGPPSSRPPYSEQVRASPPPSSIGSKYSKPPGGYRDDDPPRSNPNVTYSRPPVPRDSLGPPPARGSSPPPRRAYDAPISGSSVVPATRPYGYGAIPPGPPEPYGASRPGYDRYGPSGPPNDAYRERDRAPEYRAPPPSAPPPERYYPAANAPLPPVETYTRSAYERQPPQYDRYV